MGEPTVSVVSLNDIFVAVMVGYMVIAAVVIIGTVYLARKLSSFMELVLAILEADDGET